jgi:hypothetical protein
VAHAADALQLTHTPDTFRASQISTNPCLLYRTQSWERATLALSVFLLFIDSFGVYGSQPDRSCEVSLFAVIRYFFEMPDERPISPQEPREPQPWNPTSRVYKVPILRNTTEPRADITGPSSLPEQFFTQQNNFGTRQQRYFHPQASPKPRDDLPPPRDPAARVYMEPTLRVQVSKEPSVSQDCIEPPSSDPASRVSITPEHSTIRKTSEPRANVTGPSSSPERFFTQQNNFGTRQQRYNIRFAANYVSENMPFSLKPRQGSPSPPLFEEREQPSSPQLPTSSEVDTPALSSTLDDQSQPTNIPQDRFDREPSVERCVGCNEAWRRPLPDMD